MLIGVQNFVGMDPAQDLQRVIPVDDLMIFPDHEGRDGRTLDNAVQSLFVLFSFPCGIDKAAECRHGQAERKYLEIVHGPPPIYILNVRIEEYPFGSFPANRSAVIFLSVMNIAKRILFTQIVHLSVAGKPLDSAGIIRRQTFLPVDQNQTLLSFRDDIVRTTCPGQGSHMKSKTGVP
jgi:hypothetical protein